MKQHERFDVKAAVLYSNLAYYSPEDNKHQAILAQIKDYKKTELRQVEAFYKKSDPTVPAGYILETDNEYVVAFHGTQNLEEAKHDLDIRHARVKLEDGSEITAHSGFHNELADSNPDRKQKMEKVKANSTDKAKTKTLYTGHSLGGALAPFAAQYDNADSQNTSIITFGAAKYATESAAEKYAQQGLDSSTLRIEQAYDPIPLLPPETAGFIHVGHGVTIDIGISSKVHSLEESYDPIAQGSHREKTMQALAKLDMTKIITHKAYNPFKIDNYSKVIMGMSNSMLYNLAKIRTPLSPIIRNLSLLFNEPKPKHNSHNNQLFAKPKAPVSPKRGMFF